jgi:serine/threonine protein kinase
LEGKHLGGRYEILQHLGDGGMASVYKARDLLLNRHVAVKVLNNQLSKDEVFVNRFIREAQLAGKMSHPHIVNVFDVGQEEQTYYIVMEFVEGLTLDELLRMRGPLPAAEAMEIAIQICDGLSHAHKHGIIHRDIKPHNIMGTQDGRYKIMDFGISRLLSATTHYTKTGIVLGSVHYLSPEQATGQEVSYMSDLYSLGVVLYELVTGQVPFDADEVVAVALKHIQQPIPDPKINNPQLPDPLCHIIHKALSKKPEQRFQSADQMKNALREALNGTYKPPITSENHTEHQPVKRSKVNKKRKVLFGGSVLGIVVLLFFLGFNFVNANHGNSPHSIGFISTPFINNEDTQKVAEAAHKKTKFSEDKPGHKTDAPTKVEQQPNQSNDDSSYSENQPQIPKPPEESTPPNPGNNQEQNPPSPPPEEHPPAVKYAVIAGKFDKQEDAQNRVNQLQEKGIDSHLEQVMENGQTVYYVNAGTYDKREDADAKVEQIHQAGFNDAYVQEVQPDSGQAPSNAS